MGLLSECQDILQPLHTLGCYWPEHLDNVDDQDRSRGIRRCLSGR